MPTATPDRHSPALTAVEQIRFADIVWHSEDTAVFGIFDGAQNKNIEPLINNSQVTNSCLYSGPLDYALKRAAPHLVELHPSHQLCQTLLRDGWLQNWGILAQCPTGTPMAVVKHHFRTLARALGPQGKKLVFRYYDPRVLGLFLPTCTLAEAKRIFGPCSQFLLPCEKLNAVEIYSLDTGRSTLNVDTVSLGHATEASTKSFELPQTEANQLEKDFLRIRPEQFEQLSRGAKKQQLLTLANLFLSILKEDSDETLQPARWLELKRDVPRWLAAAQRFELRTERSMLSFLRLNYTYGEQFWQSPGTALDILAAQEESETKMAYLEAYLAQDLMDQLWS